jgi:ppGpp synthetase/RelA/SpoT-type nucleotidyltranferase
MLSEIGSSFDPLGDDAGCSGHSGESWLALMPEAELKYSLNVVKQAGKDLRDDCKDWDGLIHSMEVFENWQDCHSYPLARFYESLSGFARQTSKLTNVVQRRKRLDAVLKKLRAKRDIVQLTTMQDIAGCRAIVKGIADLEPLISVCRAGWVNHELCRTDDYVRDPDQETGYRSVHLVYKFKSEDRSFNGRFVEVQFRTRLQHAWATAVEIVDLFLKQELKAGKGDPNWQRFFALMGSAIAKIERTKQVPGTPIGKHGQELQEELRHYAELLRVEQQMEGWGSAARSINAAPTGHSINFTGISGYSGHEGRSGYFVIELDENLSPTIQGYREDQVAQAYLYVAAVEQSNPNVLLVAASDLDHLMDAYPNWIIDTHNFLIALRQTLQTEYW